MSSEWDFIIMSIVTNRHFWESFLSVKNVRILTCAWSLQKPQRGRLFYYHHFIGVTLEFSNLSSHSWWLEKPAIGSGQFDDCIQALDSSHRLWLNGAQGLRGESLLRSLLMLGADGAFHSGWFHGVSISFPWSEIPCGETQPHVLVSGILWGSWASHNYYLTIWSWRSAQVWG